MQKASLHYSSANGSSIFPCGMAIAILGGECLQISEGKIMEVIMDSKNDLAKKAQSTSDKNQAFQDKNAVKSNQSSGSAVRDTSGAEMPDPDKMPSKTDFRSNKK